MNSCTLKATGAWLICGLVAAAGASGAFAAGENPKVETVAVLPSNGSMENLCEGPDGSIYVSALNDHTIFKVTPDGKVSTFANLPVAHTVGIVALNDGFLVTAFARPIGRTPPGPGQKGPSIDMSDLGAMVLRLDKSGNVTERIEGEKGTAFNGIASAGGGAYLIADTNGPVWRLDLPAKKISLWLKAPELMPTNKELPFGADGIKVRDGRAYIGTVSGNAIYRMRIGSDGKASGKLEKFAEGFQVDDFDFGPDGSLYPTWSSDGKIRKVSPSGQMSVFIQDIPGGSATMVSKDGRWLYWPTHGGASTPSKLLRTSLR